METKIISNSIRFDVKLVLHNRKKRSPSVTWGSITAADYWLHLSKKEKKRKIEITDQEQLIPRYWSTSLATESAKLSAASCVEASAYTRTTSSVPEGRIKDRPFGYFAAMYGSRRGNKKCQILASRISRGYLLSRRAKESFWLAVSPSQHI